MKTSLRKQFGQRVKELRLASGISQEAFADKCGYARSYMSRIERGLANPSLDFVEVVAIALKVDVKALFETAGAALPTVKAKSPAILVPFAKDGTCFNPTLCSPRTKKFTVGKKYKEVKFDTFNAALEYLRAMDTACWRRQSNLVSAVRWASLPDEYLTP